MTYALDWSDAAEATVGRLDQNDLRALNSALRDLADNPQPNHGRVGRLEIGWLRVLFEVMEEAGDTSPGVIKVWSVGKVI